MARKSTKNSTASKSASTNEGEVKKVGGRPPAPFRDRVLKNAPVVNQAYEAHVATLTYPHDVESFLDFDTYFDDERKPAFDKIKAYLSVTKEARVMLSMKNYRQRLGYAKVNLEPELADIDLLQIRTSITPDLRSFTPHLVNQVRDLSEYRWSDVRAEVESMESFGELTPEQQQIALDCAQVVYRSRLNLLETIREQMDQAAINQMRNEVQAEKLNKAKAKVNQVIREEQGEIPVGAFPFIMLMLLEQIGLISGILEEWPAEIAADILEFALMTSVQDNFRPNRKKHINYAKENLSLSRRPFDSYFYTETFSKFSKLYLNTKRAADKGLIIDGNSVIASYVQINQTSFAKLGIDNPKLLMDGTSAYCQSKYIKLVSVGHYGATGQIIENIKEFTIYEHTTGLILYHAFAAGNTNDFTKTANCLRDDITKKLSYKINFEEVTFVGDRGCCSEEIVALLLNWKCQFVLYSKGDSNKLKKIREEGIKNYVESTNSTPLFHSLPVDPSKEEISKALKSSRHALQVAKGNKQTITRLVKATEIGACTSTGKLKSGNASPVDKEAERYVRISPDEEVVVALFSPQDPYARIGAVQQEWYRCYDKLYKINEGSDSPPKITEQSVYVGYTIDQLLELDPSVAYYSGVSKYASEVCKLQQDNLGKPVLEWKLEHVTKGVSYRAAQLATDEASIVERTIPQVEWLDEPFCYGIDRKKFLDQPMRTWYRMMVSKFHTNYSSEQHERNAQVQYNGQRALITYADRCYIEAYYKGNKRIDGASVHMSSISSFSIRKVTTAIAQLLRHLIRVRYQQYFKRNLKKSGTSSFSIPSMAEIQACLNGIELIVDYKEGKARIRNAKQISPEASDMLKILRIDPPKDEHLYAYLNRLWVQNVRVNGITALSMPSLKESEVNLVEGVELDAADNVEQYEALYDECVRQANAEADKYAEEVEAEDEDAKRQLRNTHFNTLLLGYVHQLKKDLESQRAEKEAKEAEETFKRAQAYDGVDDEDELDPFVPAPTAGRHYASPQVIENFDVLDKGSAGHIKDKITATMKKSTAFMANTKGMTREERKQYFAEVGRQCKLLD